MSNFLFLKKNNKDFFKIISEAENLFRDEYFEQSIVQVRRFAENICTDLLAPNVELDDTFDNLIKKIKIFSDETERKKEFIDDLYFIKKHGNNSAHSVNTENSAENALECLERAFEIAIYYIHNKYGYNKKLDSVLFSEELLMTGKITKQKSLVSKYKEELKKERKLSNSKKNPKKINPTENKIALNVSDIKEKNLSIIILFLLVIFSAFLLVLFLIN